VNDEWIVRGDGSFFFCNLGANGLIKKPSKNKIMKEIVENANLIAYCGLYCGACKAYLKEKCPGCHENSKGSWCKVRSCCIEHGYKSCADCTEFADPRECKKFNNFFSKMFALFLGSDRPACIARINESSYEEFAHFMTEHRLQSIKRN
jgi:hypothetical protein